MLGALLVTAPAAHAADAPLRDLADAKGKVMGTAPTARSPDASSTRSPRATP
jgi:hypothetical protein